MTAATAPAKGKRTLPGGRKIHLRFVQNLAWSIGAGTLIGVSIAAGWYYGFFEMWWHVPYTQLGFSLKGWWDGGMGIRALGRSSVWYLYRHAYRDEGEPVLVLFFIATLLTPPKYWVKKVSTWRLVATPLLILVLAVALITAGVYVLYFGLPDAWAYVASAAGHPGFTLDSYFAWMGDLSLGKFAVAFVISHVLRSLWRPVGATIQGFILDRSADKARYRGRVPAWVTYPLAPPTMRERFTELYEGDDEIARPGKAHRRLLAAIVLFLAVSFIIGFCAKYFIAHGTYVIYLSAMPK